MAATNQLALTLKSLHQKPNKPLVLANVYDTLSARAVAELPSCEALATASYAVARAAGSSDDDMTLAINLAGIKGVVDVGRELNKPVTVDIQDAYGDELEDAINAILDLDVVGVNLEDCNKETQKLYDADEAANRVRRALQVAKKRGVPDFVVNARCDVLVTGGQMEECLARGRKYLEAGATTVFVWGGSSRGVSKAEVTQLVEAFGGRLNVSLKMSEGGLTIKQLAEMGVARISVGPALQFMAFDTYKQEAEKLLTAL